MKIQPNLVFIYAVFELTAYWSYNCIENFDESKQPKKDGLNYILNVRTKRQICRIITLRRGNYDYSCHQTPTLDVFVKETCLKIRSRKEKVKDLGK